LAVYEIVCWNFMDAAMFFFLFLNFLFYFIFFIWEHRLKFMSPVSKELIFSLGVNIFPYFSFIFLVLYWLYLISVLKWILLVSFRNLLSLIKILNVDFTVCTSLESNNRNISISGGKNLVIYLPCTCTIIVFRVTFLIEISIYVVCIFVLKIALTRYEQFMRQ
jgi:hypothetical protein